MKKIGLLSDLGAAKQSPTTTVIATRTAPPPQATPTAKATTSKNPELLAWMNAHPQEAKEWWAEALALGVAKEQKDPLYPIKKFITVTKWRLMGIPVPADIEARLGALTPAYKTNQWDGLETVDDLARGK